MPVEGHILADPLHAGLSIEAYADVRVSQKTFILTKEQHTIEAAADCAVEKLLHHKNSANSQICDLLRGRALSMRDLQERADKQRGL